MSADRREALLNAMEASENDTLEPVVEKEIEVSDEPLRNEKGQFVAKEKDEPVEEEAEAEPELTAMEAAAEEVEKPVEEVKPAISRPTTWKKEYLPIWDKLTTGQQLTNEEALKLAEYSNQRESEYKKGVSTYRAEAQRANEIVKALEPYMGELQKNNIAPAQFVNNLAAAHYRLATGTPEQKIEMFHRLAQDYGIQLNQAGQFQQQDPYTQQLMQQLQAINQEVGSIKSRYEQEENSRLVDEIERHRQDAEHYPHFDEVRETMAQLLEQGLASDLTTAYAKAVRLNDEVWAKEQNRLLQKAQNDARKQQQVAKAKAKAVSPRSVTPSGLVDASDKKDRKSLLAQNFTDFSDRY